MKDFIDPGRIEHAIQRDEVLRGIRDRVGYRTLMITTGLQFLVGAVLLFTKEYETAGRWLFGASMASVLVLSLVEWRMGIRAAARESIRQRST